jgi:hypothetical protein
MNEKGLKCSSEREKGVVDELRLEKGRLKAQEEVKRKG